MVGLEGVGNGHNVVLAAVGFELFDDLQIIAGIVANGESAAAAIVEVVVIAGSKIDFSHRLFLLSSARQGAVSCWITMIGCCSLAVPGKGRQVVG